MRSRGPGGQNVNRTNSACVLRWNLEQSLSFDEETKAKLKRRLSNRLTKDHEILIRSDQFRDQEANKKYVIQKLYEILQRALFEPKERKKTKPKRSSVKKRLETKSKDSVTKKLRGRVQWGQD